MSNRSLKPRRPFSRVILFRGVAVLIGLSPFLAFELGLRLAGWQPAVDSSVDPYVEFSGTSPLFVPSSAGGRMEISSSRLPLFQPDSFAKTKEDDEFRIFVLGGSTVQGRPYAIETSFTTWLELSLQAADSQRTFDVVNCGGVSYASYRLVPIMQEVLQYQPDLVVLYTGHNEFLEDRSYEHVKRMNRWPQVFVRGYLALANTRSIAFLRQCYRGDEWGAESKKSKVQLAAEVDALLDYQNGLEDYHRDADWQQGVVAHFETNVRRMVQMTQAVDVPLLLINPAVNLKDCPPFKMAHSEGLPSRMRAKSEGLWTQAKSLGTADHERAISLLREAVAINDQHAGLHYHLAQCYLQAGEVELAKRHFTRAKDEDICPLRVLSSMQQCLRRIASESSSPIVDAQREFERSSDDGMTGDRWFIDHVHPTVSGHQQIAAWIIGELIEQGIVQRRGTLEDWEVERDRRYGMQMRSLDLVYFERGKQRLEGLRRWTQGRALKVRAQTITESE